jgi:hypothetical protein
VPKTSTSGQGRRKGTPNKITGDVKAMIVGALNDVGGREWLAARALDQPVAFMSLLGKVLPLQVTGENGGPMIIVTGVRRDIEPLEPPTITITTGVGRGADDA